MEVDLYRGYIVWDRLQEYIVIQGSKQVNIFSSAKILNEFISSLKQPKQDHKF